MKYRVLPGSNLNVSEVCLGTMTWGQQNSEADAHAQLDYAVEHCIDLYQIHWPQRNVPNFGATAFDPAKEKPGPSIHEQVEGMAALIAAGKIRYYGVSNESAWGVCEFRHAARELGASGPITIQNSYSLL